MSWIRGRDPVDGDVWLREPSIQRVFAPERVIYEEGWRDEIEEHERDQPYVGFAPPPTTVEPLLWEGDRG